MKTSLRQLDRILRGETTSLTSLQGGTLETPGGGLVVVLALLGLLYGLCMGSFALLREAGPAWSQFAATTLKVPLLFALTLAVTFPSLYVFNALVGSRLALVSVWRLMVAGLAVTLAVLASFGPIVAFFSLSTTSYSFMVVLNVGLFAVAGGLGLAFLLQTLHRLTLVSEGVAPPASPPAPPPTGPAASTGALDPVAGHVLGAHVKTVFRCWIVIFALVGSQMGWVLRPFLGDPETPFAWLRPRGSNFFEGVWHHLGRLLW